MTHRPPDPQGERALPPSRAPRVIENLRRREGARAILFSPRRMVQTLAEREWLSIVCTVVLLMASGLGVVTPVLPIYARTYGVSTALVGLLLTVFALGRLLVGIPAGHVADRWGPKRLLVLGPAVMAAASLGVAVSGTYPLLLLFRFLQGVGSAIQMTGGYLAVAALSPKGDIARTTGIYQSSLLLGMSIGPWLGGWAAETYGFRSPFIVQAVLAALAAFWSLRRFPRLSLKSGASDRGANGSLRVRLTSLFLNRNFVLVSLVSFTIFFARGGSKQTLLPLFGHDRLGLSVGTVGMIYAVITLFELVALSVAGGLSDRFGRKAMIVPSLVVAGLAFAWIGRTTSLPTFVIGGIILGFSTGLGGPSPAAYMSDIAPSDAYGVSFGIFRTFSDAGLILGPLLAGSIADVWGLSFPFYVTGIAMIAMGVLFALQATEVRGAHRMCAANELEALGPDQTL